MYSSLTVGGDKLIDEIAKTNEGRDPFPLLEFEIWLTGPGIEALQTEKYHVASEICWVRKTGQCDKEIATHKIQQFLLCCGPNLSNLTAKFFFFFFFNSE